MIMDPRHLNRLKEEQLIAITETEERIKQCEKFKSDYKTLQDRLKTLPHSVSHDIMVPFGKMAFMPGKIVHTNEVMVLLGDNWFAERSAKQAAEIAGRRIKELDKNIEDLNGQIKLLKPRLGFTSEIETELQGKGNVKEISEEYNEEAERLWDERHKESVRRLKEHESSQVISTSTPKTTQSPDKSMSDEKLWARLDELEKEEDERHELESDESENKHDNNEDQSITNAKREKRVSFAEHSQKESQETLSRDSDDDDYDSEESFSSEREEDTEDDDGAVVTQKGKVILFSHSQLEVKPSHQVGPSGDMSISSPADIYKLFKPPSILKKRETQEEVAQSPDNQPSLSTTSQAPERNIESNALKAFTGQVVERSLHVGQESTQKQNVEPPKRASKFRSKRMDHFGSS